MTKKRVITIILVITVTLAFGLSGMVMAKETIRLWGMPGQTFEKSNNLAVERFMKENSDIKVIYEVFPWSEFLQKIQLGFATGDVSDIIEAWGGYIPSYVKGGHLIPVTPEVFTVEEMRDFFFEAALQDITINGKIWGVPNEVGIDTGLNINVSMMERYGLTDDLESWDEVLAKAKKMVKFDDGNMTRTGITFVTDWYTVTYTFHEFIYKLGGNPWGEDGIHIDLSTPEAAQAATLITDLVLKDKVASAELETAVGHQMDMLFSGQTAMANKGPQIAGKGPSIFPDFPDKIDYIPIPPLTRGGKQVVVGEAGWTWVLTKATKNRDAAIRFMRYLGSPENLLARHLLTGHPPPAPYVAGNPETLKLRPYFEPFVDLFQHLKMLGPTQDSDRFCKIVAMNLRDVMDGRATVKEALAKAEKEINEMIDELR